MQRAKLRLRGPGREGLPHWKSIRTSGCQQRPRALRKSSSARESGPKMQYIADTGFIAGFWDKNDRVRNWSRRIALKNPGPHITCEAALVEASYLVGPQRIARAFVEGDYEIEFSWEAQRAEVLDLLDRYSDYQMDVADACVV